MKKLNKKDYLIFVGCFVMALFAIYYNQQIQAENAIYFPRPLTADDLQKYSNTDPNAVVIYPILTQLAYGNNGFYAYYNKTCDSCNIISLNLLKLQPNYTSSKNSLDYLSQLHYGIITDIMVDKHPEILKDYDKIILLHNEYMTKAEFEAIKNHPNVIYLYPNAMYAEVNVDYNKNTMTLIRGHGYPEKDILNGFDYVTTSNHEYDLNCKNYKWESRPNGIQITCWPEFLIKSDRNVLQTIKDFPDKIPPLIEPVNTVRIASLPVCDYFGHCVQKQNP